MISETNRKRRKLDRERRALDRHQPSKYLKSHWQGILIEYCSVRRIPSPPREVPPAPYIRDLFKSSLDMPESKKRHLPEQDLVYPQLSSLTPHDIANDLEFLFAHRRNMMGYRRCKSRLYGL